MFQSSGGICECNGEFQETTSELFLSSLRIIHHKAQSLDLGLLQVLSRVKNDPTKRLASGC